jgi:hypothetical protein
VGCVCPLQRSVSFGCSSLIYVVQGRLVMFVVWVSLGVICANLRSVGEVRFSVISQCVSLFFVCHSYVSALHLKCTKHMGYNSDVH